MQHQKSQKYIFVPKINKITGNKSTSMQKGTCNRNQINSTMLELELEYDVRFFDAKLSDQDPCADYYLALSARQPSIGALSIPLN